MILNGLTPPLLTTKTVIMKKQILMLFLLCGIVGYGQTAVNAINSTARVLYEGVCGLDCQLGSVATNHRETVDPFTLAVINPAASAPHQINIAGIPAGAQILEARVWFTVVGLDQTDPRPFFSFNDPTGAFHSYNNNSPGYDLAGYYGNTTGWLTQPGCSNSNGTVTYTIDVTSTIPANPNGNYTFTSFPQSSPITNQICGADTDGISLLIVYRNPGSSERASIAVWDGASHVPNNTSAAFNQPLAINTYGVPGNDIAFTVYGDAEYSHSLSLLPMLQPLQTTSPGAFWHQNVVSGSFNTSWTTYDFTISNNSPQYDEVTAVLMGVYTKDAPLNVVATQPVLDICTTDPPFNLGAEYTPTGNVYWTAGYFTPTDGFDPVLLPTQPVGGSFVGLTIGGPIGINSFPPYDLYEFDPSNGTGGTTYDIIYSYTQNPGCTQQDTMQINLHDPPNVVAAQPVITLCQDDDPITLGTEYIPTGNVYWTNNYFTPTDGFDPVLLPTQPIGGQFTILPSSPCVTVNTISDFNIYELDPSMCPIGTHTIEYTYTDAATGCSASATMQVNIQSGQWHQTTSNATAFPNTGDTGNDIYTDGDGYVYATGSFYEQTTFDDGMGNVITITADQPDLINFYAVCHNACGELQWVIYDDFVTSPSWSEGFGISKKQDEILIGLTYNDETELITVYPSGTTVASPFNGGLGLSTIGNVAVIAVDGPASPTFGEINAIEDSYPNHLGRALDTEDNGATIGTYICGKSDANANSVSNVFAARLTYTVGGGFAPNWNTVSTQESLEHVGNDIKLDLNTGELLLTGTFRHTLTLTGSTVVTGAARDAYLAFLNPTTGAISGGVLHNLGISISGYAEGTCLASDDNGYIHFGGDYRGTVANPFNGIFGGAPALAMNSVTNSSYVYSYDVGAGTVDIDEIYNNMSYTRLTGMDANEDELVFVGYYDRGQPQIGGVTNSAFNLVGGLMHYIFIGEADLSGGGWNAPAIINSTQDVPPPGSKHNHISTRVSLYGDEGFLTGTYKGSMDYFNGTPASGVLNASGVNTEPHNAFIMRHQLVSNELRISDTDTNEGGVYKVEGITENELTKLNVYPNPAQNFISVEIPQSTAPVQLTIYSSSGALIHDFTTQNAIEKIDLSEMNGGFYFIQVSGSFGTLESTFIKE